MSRYHFDRLVAAVGGEPPASFRRRLLLERAAHRNRHHVWLVGEILDRARHLADEVLDRPVELSVDGIDDHPTFRGLLHRLVGQQEMWLAAVEGRGRPDNDPPPETALDYVEGRPPRETLSQLRARYADVGSRFVGLLETVEREGDLGAGDPMTWIAERV